MNRLLLIDEWRNRLAQCQAELSQSRQADQPVVRDWVRRAYVRVLTFMLAQYGHASTHNRADGSGLPVDTPPTSTRLDLPLVSPGLRTVETNPPKSAARICKQLESIHGRALAVTAGPLAAGIQDDSLVVVATVRHISTALLVQWKLRKQGISSKLQCYASVWSIAVKHCTREAADRILNESCDLNLNREMAFVATLERNIMQASIAWVLLLVWVALIAALVLLFVL